MTRINANISPMNLTDEHLLAEHREIKRLPHNYQMALKSGSINHIPKEFVLGKGHVIFFVDKPLFTLSRYQELRDECIRRGFMVDNYSRNWSVYGGAVSRSNKSYTPSDRDNHIIIERITERLRGGKKQVYHYYGHPITVDQAINILNNQK